MLPQETLKLAMEKKVKRQYLAPSGWGDLKRIKSFTTRFLWLKEFMPSVFHTLFHLVRMKIDPKCFGKAKYKETPFLFCPQDMSAIREVLVDQEYAFLKTLLKELKTPTILDVGANIGMFALWVFAQNKEALILSLEASPETYKTVEKNSNFAQDAGYSWCCKNGAAWKNNEIIYFATDGDSMGHKVLESGGHKVKGITLRQLIDLHLAHTNASRIDVLKVDIEGAEEHFLTNTTETKDAMSLVNNLVIELHPNYCNVEPVEELIKECFAKIDQQTDRVSSKPVLHCYN